ncbi:MAG TPA: IS21 family transposase [Ktedonobacteraceae bacterium]
MISVEEHETIRRLYYLEHQSGRQIAKTLGISRQSVAKALQAERAPIYTLSKPRAAPQLGPYKARIEELLIENKRLPKKQRYTTHKIFELLQAQGYSGSESSVQGYAVRWRKTHRRPATFLPLEFEPGQDAQVDWGEAQAMIAGVPQMVQVFVMRLNYSRRSFVMAFPAQKQEAFFEGHVRAFEHFAGVPHRLSYDNLATAVKILVKGRIREEQRAYTAFRSYYLFTSHFCTPGQGHEKGGVEHSVGFSRRNFLVPIPQVASFEALNTQLLEACVRDDVRIVHGQTMSIGHAWQAEQPYFHPLPRRPFDCCVTRQAHLTPYSQVIYETNRYSVPVEQARRELVVKAYPFRIEILDTSEVIASHPRCYGHEQDVFDPLHYLTLLEQRPGAFEYARPLKQWRKSWPASYHRLLSILQEKWPEGRGVKEFVRILKLHQTYAAHLVEQAVEQALSYGCTHFDGVQHCLDHLHEPTALAPLLDLSDKPHLATVGNQPLDLHSYDQLVERVAHS